MNERIVELLKQAGGIQYDEDGDELTAILVGKDLERFAELIVQECADVADCHWRNGSPGVYVKEHFGVEIGVEE